MRFAIASLVVHAVLVAWLWKPRGAQQMSTPRLSPNSENTAIHVEVIALSAPSGGGQGAVASPARTRAKRVISHDAWDGLSISNERGAIGNGNGSGNGNGNGNGNENGIGFGNGGGVTAMRDIPATPPAPEPSKARPAKLVWPNRDLEVTDESYLFIARVTVDREGSVVGARMVKTRPGSKGDHAANAIWSFRYAPALDDCGAPIASTFEQQFQVR